MSGVCLSSLVSSARLSHNLFIEEKIVWETGIEAEEDQKDKHKLPKGG